jgi:hypothetical protein
MNGGSLTSKKALVAFAEARLILETGLAALCAERIASKL